MKKILFLFAFFSVSVSLSAQQTFLPLPKEYVKAIEKGTRNSSGQPGENYWLNHAQYVIKVKFDPEERKLTGSETIEYTNNSSDTLQEIVVATYQDILSKHNKRDWSFPIEKLNEGVILTKVEVAGKKLDLNNNKQIRKLGTNRIIKLQEPVLPKSKVQLKIDWNFTFVKNFNVRGGEFSNQRFFLNYFYPKIAVYDDIDGWDKHSYTGYAEMYSDFSSYRLEVTVPDEFKVWGTGELKNAEELLTKKILKRYKKAHKSETVVRIITPDDLDNNELINGTGDKTWIFESAYVPDVAFAMGKRILWDGLSFVRNKATGEKLFLDAAYDPESKDFYEVTEISKGTIIDMMENSVRWPFPYPQYTVFNGGGGMEFPMMCNNGSQGKKKHTVGLAYHEIAHTYFPFFMGTNERKYAWMDEGWARMLPTDYQDKHFDDYYTPRTQKSYLKNAGREGELPPITITYLNTFSTWYRQASYNKPQFSYLELRHYLGEKTFYNCLKEYMKRWNGKHPIPQDFFNTFNTISGKNLNWFWKNWYYDKNHPDIKVNAQGKKLTLENKGGLFTAFKLTVVLEDGSTKEFNYNTDFWLQGLKREMKFGKKIKSVETSSNFDTYPSDNSWKE